MLWSRTWDLVATTPDDYDSHSQRPEIFNQKPKHRTLKTFFRGKHFLKHKFFLQPEQNFKVRTRFDTNIF